MNSLLTTVIPRGCKSYPNTAVLNKRFEELYGAGMGCQVKKKGETQTIHFGFEFVNDKFLPAGENLFGSIMEMAEEIVFNHSPFDEKQVEQEKENLRTLIMSIFNDKRTYAQVRMIEEMCKGEAYGILDLGNAEDIPAIDCDTLYAQYKNVLLASPLDIFFVGDVSRDDVIAKAEKLAEYMNVTDDYPDTEVISIVDEVKTVIQREKIAQAKLSMGFRTGVSVKDGDYYALTVYNAIFGGGPYSRLFNNVREKMSLCYYVSSATDRLKGIMCVNAGIEADKFEVARDAILEQERIVRMGEFSDEELEAAKLCLIDSLRGIADSQRRTEDFGIGQLIGGTGDSLDEYIANINSVTRERIVAAAANVKLDTVYLLTKEDEQ